MSDIILRDVEKYFGDNYIIRKLNLEIRAREFVVLLGPSGCGKTTTLRAIAGLEDIDSGDILIDGKAVQRLRAAERDIAFVFQLFALYPHLTAYENIAFPLRATNESNTLVEQRVHEVAKALRIDHLLQKRPSALSGGDMQRVAIGRALVRRPKALLMDEPIGALDAKLREEMRTELKHIHLQNEATTVYVTHDQVEAMAMADKIAIMNEGVLQQVGYAKRGLPSPAESVRCPVHRQPDHERDERRRSIRRCRYAVGAGEDDATLSFPRELYHRLVEHKRAEGELSIGVRPEGVLVMRQPTEGYIPAEAHIIEPLGPYDIVDLKLGKLLVRARTPSGFVDKAGDMVWVRLDEKQTHFFSTRSGESLNISL
jgi:multiple sugar transport system ATP-binding protein